MYLTKRSDGGMLICLQRMCCKQKVTGVSWGAHESTLVEAHRGTLGGAHSILGGAHRNTLGGNKGQVKDHFRTTERLGL